MLKNDRLGPALITSPDQAHAGPAADSAIKCSQRAEEESIDRRAPKLWALALALLAFAVRAPGLFAGFVFDDAWGMQQRMAVGWSRVPGFFTSDQSALFGSNFYRPVLSVCYALVYSLGGSQAWVWHLTSILLHVACTVLVFRFALLVIERPATAALAAALFAVHPAHVEAISWASALADPLWTMLMLVSVVAYVRWMERGSGAWLAASLLAGAAAIFTKETAVVTPLVLLVTVLALRRRAKPGLPVLAATLPFSAMAALFLYLRHSVLHSFSHPLTVASNAQMLLTWPAALLFYLRHMFWPPVVAPFYPLQIVTRCSAALFVAPLLGLVAAAGVLLYVLWRAAGWNKTFLCLAWTLLPLAPALYLKAFAPFELVHDRLLYAPLVGFCLAGALVLQWAADRIETATQFRVFAVLSIALVPLLAIQSVSQAVWWQNNKTLFTRAVSVTPDNPKALANLAGAYLAEHLEERAAPLLQRAMQLAPNDSTVLYGMSLLSSTRGDDMAAESYIIEALRQTSRYDMWLQLAAVELRLNKLDVAVRAARQSIAMNGEADGVHAALGYVLLAQGDKTHAIEEFQRELHNYPANRAAREGIARAMHTR